MSNSMMYIVWAVAIVGFGVLEAVTAQLVSIWFVVGSIAGLVSALFDAPIYLQFFIGIGVSVAALIATRPIIHKRLHTEAQPTNADRCIGQVAVVMQEIDNIKATGEVKIDGKMWTARSSDGRVIQPNKEVVVEKIDGVKLIVTQR